MIMGVSMEHHSLQKLLKTLFSAPYGFLMFGIVCGSLAVSATDSGRVRTRFHGWCYRTKEPKAFW